MWLRHSIAARPFRPFFISKTNPGGIYMHEDYNTNDEEQYYPPRPTRHQYTTTRVTRALIIVLASIAVTLLLVVAMIRPHQLSPQEQPVPRLVKSAPVTINWSRLRSDVGDGMEKAEIKAEDSARLEIKNWMHDLRSKAQKGFLDELLSYTGQQRLAFLGIYYQGRHYIDPTQPCVEDAIAKDIEQIFCQQTMSPPICQAKLESITAATVALYLAEIGKNLEVLPTTYCLNEAQWSRFLGDAAKIVWGHGTTRRIPLLLKGIAVSTLTFSAAMAVPTAQLLRVIVAKLTGRAVVTTTSTAVKSTGRLCGPTFLAIVAWDTLDYFRTRSKLRPLLTASLDTYFDSIETVLLEEVMGAVNGVAVKIISAMEPK